jgi:hypothetical protein
MDLDRLTDEFTARPTPPVPPWSRERLHELGVSTDLLTAAKLLHIGRTKAYQLARAGKFPVPVVRIGRTYTVTVAHLIDLLRLDERAS